MSVQQVPGFNGGIEITDSSSKTIFSKPISSKAELSEFIASYASSKEQWGLFRTAACPLNRGSIEQFVTDFTFPTLFNFATKVEGIAGRIFATLFAICFDLFTLPLRIVSLPYVFACAASDSPHALESLIKEPVVDEVVTINYRTEEVEIQSKFGSKEIVTGVIKVALKTIPMNPHETSEKREKRTYLIDRGSWIELANLQGQNSSNSFCC